MTRFYINQIGVVGVSGKAVHLTGLGWARALTEKLKITTYRSIL